VEEGGGFVVEKSEEELANERSVSRSDFSKAWTQTWTPPAPLLLLGDSNRRRGPLYEGAQVFEATGRIP